MLTLRLSRAQLDQLVAQARRDAPNETCGFLAGTPGQALAVYPLRNAARNPLVEYDAAGPDLVAAWTDIEARGWDVVSIYHSHPGSPAYPSPTDLARAYSKDGSHALYPGAVYIILSLRHPDRPEVHAFALDDHAVREVALEVEAGGGDT